MLMHNLEQVPEQVKDKVISLYEKTVEQFEKYDSNEETIGIINRCMIIVLVVRAFVCSYDRSYFLFTMQRDVSPLLCLWRGALNTAF